MRKAAANKNESQVGNMTRFTRLNSTRLCVFPPVCFCFLLASAAKCRQKQDAGDSITHGVGQNALRISVLGIPMIEVVLRPPSVPNCSFVSLFLPCLLDYAWAVDCE